MTTTIKINDKVQLTKAAAKASQKAGVPYYTNNAGTVTLIDATFVQVQWDKPVNRLGGHLGNHDAAALQTIK